jgi:hypothetical protein
VILPLTAYLGLLALINYCTFSRELGSEVGMAHTSCGNVVIPSHPLTPLLAMPQRTAESLALIGGTHSNTKNHYRIVGILGREQRQHCDFSTTTTTTVREASCSAIV